MAYIDGNPRLDQLTKDGQFDKNELNLRNKLRAKTNERIKFLDVSAAVGGN